MHRKETYPSFSRGLKIPRERKSEKAPEDVETLWLLHQSKDDRCRKEKKKPVWVWKVLSQWLTIPEQPSRTLGSSRARFPLARFKMKVCSELCLKWEKWRTVSLILLWSTSHLSSSAEPLRYRLRRAWSSSITGRLVKGRISDLKKLWIELLSIL